MQGLHSPLSLAQALGPKMNSYRVMSYRGSDLDLGPYLGFILSNWLTTLRFTNDWFKLIDEKTYYDVYPNVVKAILNKPQTQVNLALMEDDPDVCVGFSVYEGETLHYCFVPRHGRKQGIGRSLITQPFKKMTHLTLPGVVIWKTKFPDAVFDPFSI